MKKWMLAVSAATLLAVSGCQEAKEVSKPKSVTTQQEKEINNDLKLVSTKIEIAKDKSRSGGTILTEGKDKGKQLVPTTIYYEFVLKNTGKHNIGSLDNKRAMTASLKADPSLEKKAKEIIGFNPFKKSGYDDASGLGYGQGSVSLLKSHDKGDYGLSFDIGFTDENDQGMTMLNASDEQLDELKKELGNATLIIKEGKKVIGEFPLNKR